MPGRAPSNFLRDQNMGGVRQWCCSLLPRGCFPGLDPRDLLALGDTVAWEPRPVPFPRASSLKWVTLPGFTFFGGSRI